MLIACAYFPHEETVSETVIIPAYQFGLVFYAKYGVGFFTKIIV